MAKQLHKRFSTEEVKMLLQKYLDDKKKLAYILQILQVTRRRFFHLLEMVFTKLPISKVTWHKILLSQAKRSSLRENR